MRSGLWAALRLHAALLGCALAWAPAAQAANLDLNTSGALLALPVITGQPLAESFTAATITNTGGPVVAHINVLSGDPGDLWLAQDFDCPLTRNETALFVFEGSGAGSTVRFECSGPERSEALVTRNGILVVTVEDPSTRETINTNQLFGDAIVLDAAGGTAYSVGAIPFQGIAPGPGVGDRQYRFDNSEYSAFPSALVANFAASRSASLVLFTLDGTTGSATPPEVELSIKFTIGRSGTGSSSHHFDCFDIVDLATIDGRFGVDMLGRAGRLVMRPEPATQPNLAHDSLFDGGESGTVGVRTTPAHGWIFQTMSVAGQVVGAFGSSLKQSNLPLLPSPGDTPTLFAP